MNKKEISKLISDVKHLKEGLQIEIDDCHNKDSDCTDRAGTMYQAMLSATGRIIQIQNKLQKELDLI
tara:strand:- start:552 stop:752 length:201 start_codon:yes stop_codon:yes gene_type:complete